MGSINLQWGTNSGKCLRIPKLCLHRVMITKLWLHFFAHVCYIVLYQWYCRTCQYSLPDMMLRHDFSTNLNQSYVIFITLVNMTYQRVGSFSPLYPFLRQWPIKGVICPVVLIWKQKKIVSTIDNWPIPCSSQVFFLSMLFHLVLLLLLLLLLIIIPLSLLPLVLSGKPFLIFFITINIYIYHFYYYHYYYCYYYHYRPFFVVVSYFYCCYNFQIIILLLSPSIALLIS